MSEENKQEIIRRQAQVIADLMTERLENAVAELGLVLTEANGKEYFLLQSATFTFHNNPRCATMRIVDYGGRVHETTLDPEGDAEVIHQF